ncbi:altronate oxidoreductase [Klebsiella pneumoniae]|uniref:Altronate oxidoreductase n=1 Tax=Klebsiella pneumoniae TaxID=573 RepID=A0A3S4KBQ9_KLEPN|nr:altronate oxidoreductase [Klebsiella pneumoniae]
MNDAEICAFVEKAIYDEIIPVLDLPRDELVSFASAVTGRFRNPYIKHQLLSIALKWHDQVPHPYSAAAAGGAESAWCTAAASDLCPGGADRLLPGESGMVRAIQYRMTPTGYRAIKRCGPAIAMAR